MKFDQEYFKNIVKEKEARQMAKRKAEQEAAEKAAILKKKR
jgi:hypothetical protein